MIIPKKNKMYKLFIIFILFWFSTNYAFSQYNKNEELIFDFQKKLYNYEFVDAQKQLALIENSKIEKDLKLFLKITFYRSQIQSFNNLENYDSLCFEKSKILIKHFSNYDSLSFDQIFILVSTYFYITEIDISNKKYIRAALNLREITKYIELIISTYKKNEKLKLIAGIYFFYAELAAEDHLVLQPILYFFPKGDKKKGLKLLLECTSSKDFIICTEAYNFLARIYFRDEKIYKLAELFYKNLVLKYPKNLNWQAELFKVYKKNINSEKQKSQFETYSKELENNNQLNDIQKNIFRNKIKK